MFIGLNERINMCYVFVFVNSGVLHVNFVLVFRMNIHEFGMILFYVMCLH